MVRLFGWGSKRTKADRPVKKTGRPAKTKADRRSGSGNGSGGASRDYHAVLIRPGLEGGCDAVQALQGEPFLSSDAPRLPVVGCSTPEKCRCQYRHLKDRRTNVRRNADHGIADQYYHGEERRADREDRRKK